MIRRKIALDADGVLLDFDRHFQRHMEYKLGRKLPVLSDSFQLTARYGIDGFWNDLAQDAVFWSGMPLLPDAKNLIYALEDMGFEVWVVTAIGEEQRKSRAISLSGLIPAGRIVCAGWTATPQDKANILHDLGTVGFLDDQWEHVLHAGMLPKMLCTRYYCCGRYDVGEVPVEVGVVDDVMDFPVALEASMRRWA
ncbi:hypothetical protein [Acidithiobacillus sulfurivorans]|uniref:HAD family hydrolase n=1 Tax=Acidithiobacillus sulfurivorans TaxID=1958756 RepID=A0ABS6A0Y4_9PROT|nr:hypothetical protein [Acidithiobacillus sulfurivorans]MBU2761080.1 hypothetical protein [Acidithiobacillus sulfurivorans]